jgi:uncharacterized repeat protein (TIGR02543 family)
MKNERGTMNNKKKSLPFHFSLFAVHCSFVLFAVICSLFILAGCLNPVNNNTQISGKGSLMLVIDSDDSRTILPIGEPPEFAAYTLKFTPVDSGEMVDMERNNASFSNPINLEPGTYNILVTAYLDDEKTKPVAQGSLNGIQINAGQSITRSITLSALIASGRGTFRWNIGFSDGLEAELTEARIEISRVDGTGRDTLYLGMGGTPQKGMSDSFELDSGYYRVWFIFGKEGTEHIRWREILHVYQNLTSVFVYTFTPAHFNNVCYTVTYVYNDGLTPDMVQDRLHGETASPPVPERTGYMFNGWYSDVGLTTAYDVETQLTDSITLYAGWNLVYTVTFMDGNTVLSALTRTVLPGSTVTRPADPAKNGYIFHNWYKDSGLTTLFGFNTPITEQTSVYAGWGSEEFGPGTLINNIFNVATTNEWNAAVSSITGGGNDKNYVINATADFSVEGSTAVTFGSVSGITVSLRGAAYQGYGRTLTLSGTENILRTGTNQNIILRDLSLRGRDSNTGCLVYVNSGTFTMYGGEISGNKINSLTLGGGVYVNNSGTFTMFGGEISGNTASYGGGVYVANGGSFYIVTGTIYGSGEDQNVKNTANSSSASLYRGSTATAEYGTFNESTWNWNGSLSTTNNDTIRVINGVLQPSFNSVSANCFPTLTTTAITLTFSQAIPGLSADDIILSGVPGVIKGQLSGTGPSYLLPISGFTQGGILSVSVSKAGYTVGGPRTAFIYYTTPYAILIELVTIPAGTFTMGSPANEPNRLSNETQHEVTLTGFRMGKYQVTQEQYESIMGTNPSFRTTPVSPETSTANRPVEQVSWYDALVFCNRLSMLGGVSPAYRINGSTDPEDWGTVPTNSDATWNAVQIVEGSTGWRLPTEAQWEYACRARTATAYNWGTDTIDPTQANFGFSLNRTTEVGSYASNAWGLYDMHGNVWEWCWDWIDNYDNEVRTDPTGPVSGSSRVRRGGSMGIPGEYLRSAMREYEVPNYRNNGTGFRLVRPSTDSALAYTVIFTDGDTVLSDLTRTVTSGSTVTKPDDPAKDGYIFDNWYSDSDLSALYNFSTPITGGTTLYAKWSFELPVRNVSLIVPYLETQAGTTANPANLSMQMDLGTMTQADSGWRQILAALNTAGKYVDLDLSCCTMSGTVFNPDYSVSTGKDKIVSIALPNTAISITAGSSNTTSAFYRFTALKSFSGMGLTSIGNYAFHSRASLTQTSLPAGITSIGNRAFYDCTSLALTSLPAGINTIGDYAFRGCTDLALTELPAGTTSIGDGAFYYCASIALTELPAGITSIKVDTFNDCTSLALAELPAGITSIGESAFVDCTHLTEISLPSGLSSIGDSGFRNCTNLALVTCHATTPPTLKKNLLLGDFAFAGTAIQQIKVPAGSVDTYKTATGWKDYAGKISAAE